MSASRESGARAHERGVRLDQTNSEHQLYFALLLYVVSLMTSRPKSSQVGCLMHTRNSGLGIHEHDKGEGRVKGTRFCYQRRGKKPEFERLIHLVTHDIADAARQSTFLYNAINPNALCHSQVDGPERPKGYVPVSLVIVPS